MYIKKCIYLMMISRRLIALAIVSIFFIQSISLLSMSQPRAENTISTQVVSYPNSDVSSLWVRKNGSDPGFPFPNENVAPSYGMSYFGTNVIQVTWDYNFTEISSALFPSNAEIYMQAQYDASYYTAIADFALTDSRIKGAFIDDFQVGLQSPTNMSAYYTALSHNDGTLGYHLTLGLIVYNRNYFIQSPYSWDDIDAYFDIIHFWYYPFTYDLLYPGFAGYEDDFETLHSWLPTKEYWMGIYLHYYNIGDYPLNFTAEQLSVAGKLMKMGMATRFSILENFWIQNNPETSELVRDFINDEYQADYSTELIGNTIASYTGSTPLLYSLITDYESKMYFVIRSFELFHSTALQNLTVTDVPNDDYMITNLRNGNYQYPFFYNSSSQEASYILEPGQDYRLMYFPTTDLYLNGTTYFNSSYGYTSRHIIVNGELNISGRLSLDYCIVDFGNNHFENSMFNSTRPDFGIEIQNNNSAELDVSYSIIEPVNRAYPYHFERIYGTSGTAGTLNFLFTGSVVACHSGKLRPSGEVWMINTTWFQVQPVGATINSLLWLETPSYIQKLDIEDCLFWNYDVSGAIGVFLMPGGLWSNLPSTHLVFDRNTIVGGNWGLWVDFHYSDSITIKDYQTYPASDSGMFTTFRLDGVSSKVLRVETSTIYNWSVKNVAAGPSISMIWTYIPSGVYIYRVDATASNVVVSETTLTLTYSGPWLAYRDNFSLVRFGFVPGTTDNIINVMWLMIFFLPIMAFVQVVPRIGFLFGAVLMLVLMSFADSSFLPYMFIGLSTIGVAIYKGVI